MKKYRYVIITLLTAVAISLCGVFALFDKTAKADTTVACELTPIRTEQNNVTYYCFDDPASVFADGEVIIVAGQDGVYYVTDNGNGGKDVAFKNTPADKVYRYTRHESNAGYLIALDNGRIFTVGGDGEQKEFTPDISSNESYIDFTVWNNTLFALTETQIVFAPLTATEIDGENAGCATLSADRYKSISAHLISVADGQLYVTLSAVYGNKQDICVVDAQSITDGGAAELTVVYNQSDEILSLSAYSSGKIVYALTRSELVGYTMSVSGGLIKLHQTDGATLSCVYAYGDNLYALDTLNALIAYSSDLTFKNVIAAAASDAPGLYNIPSGITVKNSALYIADTMNGRIAVYSNTGITYIDRVFNSPVSVAIDNYGTTYVAYDNNKVGVFRSALYSNDDEFILTDVSLGKIKQILVDNENTLFVLADSGLWRAERDAAALKRISDTRYKSLSLSIGKNNLYALGDDKVVCLDKSNGQVEKAFAVDSDAISITVDLNDSIFALFRDKIVKIAGNSVTEYGLSLDGKPYELGDKSGQILLGFIENSLLNGNGDGEGGNDTDNALSPLDQDYLLVLDTYKHRILKADGEAVGARFLDYSYESPDIIGDNTAAAQQSGIIRTLRYDALLYPYPIETKSEYSLTKDSYVIVPDYGIVAPGYDPDETPEFALVLVDDYVNNKLLQGYVYRDALSAPLPYSAPPSEICTVSGELGTIVYKWPSRNSIAVTGHEEVAKNTKFDMLDFVGGFRDGYGYYWYRIALENGGEGYVPAVNISTIDYQQTNILPDYNAEIISYKNSNFAQAYTLDSTGKSYIAIPDILLAAGTKVEVVGSFDSSERYTKIRFLDEKTHKTITCYVETCYISYNGVNIVLIAAIIVIAITVILAIIILSRYYYAKKKRVANDTDKTDSNDDDEPSE